MGGVRGFHHLSQLPPHPSPLCVWKMRPPGTRQGTVADAAGEAPKEVSKPGIPEELYSELSLGRAPSLVGRKRDANKSPIYYVLIKLENYYQMRKPSAGRDVGKMAKQIQGLTFDRSE